MTFIEMNYKFYNFMILNIHIITRENPLHTSRANPTPTWPAVSFSPTVPIFTLVTQNIFLKNILKYLKSVTMELPKRLYKYVF